MITLIFTVSELELKNYKFGVKTFHIAKFKNPPARGQQVIFQTANDEFKTVISDVHHEIGTMKDYAILSFGKLPVENKVVDLTTADFGKGANEDLEDIFKGL